MSTGAIPLSRENSPTDTLKVSSTNCYALKFTANTAPVSSFGYSSHSPRRDIELELQDKPAMYISDANGLHCSVVLDFRDTFRRELSRSKKKVEIVLLSKT